MPHLTLEYSANLSDASSMDQLCHKLAKVLVAQQEIGKPVFPIGGVRVRALRCEQYAIADGRADAAFLHANLKIGAGRSDSAKRAAGDALFETIKAHFRNEFEKSGLALSLEIGEFSEAGTWKHNNLHARLKGEA
ncbi:5-carboxymethyl-2-hydroxymuconate Delta-isomerase [Paraburkholderia sp. MPAMCS5]|uniref:5-carboxymethyl-2-hydroxymuconate Delta-isomerase n=1 Tax=Paraburkholderia sp. MPAMCS5 TaxID=3112563 RepID=UPI002E18EBCE|nr:5-carboxymethyl-2-hydroxymuconate Delta-isomerase [Paraburkholderia sp. MPAMCS5]